MKRGFMLTLILCGSLGIALSLFAQEPAGREAVDSPPPSGQPVPAEGSPGERAEKNGNASGTEKEPEGDKKSEAEKESDDNEVSDNAVEVEYLSNGQLLLRGSRKGVEKAVEQFREIEKQKSRPGGTGTASGPLRESNVDGGLSFSELKSFYESVAGPHHIASDDIVVAWNKERDIAWGYSLESERWARQTLDPPATGAPVVGTGVAYWRSGNKIYAFGAKAGQWDVLTFPAETTPRVRLDADMVFVSTDKSLHIFSGMTGKWASPQDPEQVIGTHDFQLSNSLRSVDSRALFEVLKQRFPDLTFNLTGNKKLVVHPRSQQELRELQEFIRSLEYDPSRVSAPGAARDSRDFETRAEWLTRMREQGFLSEQDFKAGIDELGTSGAAATKDSETVSAKRPTPIDARHSATPRLEKTFTLQHVDSELTASYLSTLFPEAVVVEHEDRNQVSVAAVGKELLDEIASFVERLDAAAGKVEDSPGKRRTAEQEPRYAPADGAVKRRPSYEETHREALRIAGVLRELQNERDLSGGKTDADRAKLQAALRQTVAEAFQHRQQQQRAELSQLQARLEKMQQTVDARDRLADQIIDRRVEELLDPNLKWDVADDPARPYGTPIGLRGPARFPGVGGPGPGTWPQSAGGSPTGPMPGSATAPASASSGRGMSLLAITVTGRVTLNGKPVERARVIFHTHGSPSRRFQAFTDVVGRFELSTYFAGGETPPQFTVTVSKIDSDLDAVVPWAKNGLPRKYASVSTSPLTVTVEPGGDNEFEFDLRE